MTGSDVYRWVKDAPVERVTLPAAAALYTATEAMHLTGALSGFDIALPVAVAAGVTYGRIVRRGSRDPDEAVREEATRRARAFTASIAAAGGWVTFAVEHGVAAGPYHAASIGYVLGAFAGYKLLRNFAPVRQARELRKMQRTWHGLSHDYGLGWSHLLDYEETWLGERMLIDTRETKRKASSIIRGGDIAEGIAEHLLLPPSRVRVTGDRIAGRVWVTINRRDPWKDALPHPLIEDTPDLPFDLPLYCTSKKPMIVGYVPENGKPLTLTLWDRLGAKVVLVVGMRGAGKSALLSCLRERITACDDAVIWDINAAKGREDHDWTPACDLTAIGKSERERALNMLELACVAVEWRSSQPRHTGDLHPSPRHPLLVLILDEFDTMVGGNDWIAARAKIAVQYLASKARSEAVALLLAAQRGTNDWIGGGGTKANIDEFVIGKVDGESEIRNAVREYAPSMPNMADYGEGEPGVWAIGHRGVAARTGRNFKLTEPPDLQRIAAERREWLVALEPGLVAHLGERYAELKRSQVVTVEPWADEDEEPRGSSGPPEWPTAPGDDGGSLEPDRGAIRAATAVLNPESSLEMWDGEMDEALSPELRERMAGMRETSADTSRVQAEAQEIRDRLPEVDPDRLTAAFEERWNQKAAQDGPPPDWALKMITDLLRGGGASGRSVARQLAETAESDIKRNMVDKWLNWMRSQGLAQVVGVGRPARWMLTDEIPTATTDSDSDEGAGRGDGQPDEG
jgi:hypothetical protein